MCGRAAFMSLLLKGRVCCLRATGIVFWHASSPFLSLLALDAIAQAHREFALVVAHALGVVACQSGASGTGTRRGLCGGRGSDAVSRLRD